jgi:hypothetical protein
MFRPKYIASDSPGASRSQVYRGLEALLDRHAPPPTPACVRSCGFEDVEEVRTAVRRMEFRVIGQEIPPAATKMGERMRQRAIILKLERAHA